MCAVSYIKIIPNYVGQLLDILLCIMHGIWYTRNVHDDTLPQYIL